ncbi:polysialic acid transporter [Alkanindiges hydrocarboniclasticus]|jgi:capsular polysaccharide transport system permease protein|uniref:Transport permease protein n=1 Tax=Alkanindiges hydrocarboniclasticus TaxID=1907941 RepID=A0A1S8CXC4_9GAMM|nr:ABC transporter permease [Alkanindiges hydrocarboniclasticus]ONG41684.1 polysialic acid transporter [Alkanindiges hydrocarboniclasticus]
MTEIIDRPLPLKPRGGLAVQYAAIRALFLRELQTRFGHYRLGYLWAILEPGLLVGTKLVLFGSIMQRAIPSMSYSLFLICGVLPFLMVMRSATKSMGAVSSNKGLFIYRSVKPIDAVIARVLLEGILYFIVFFIFLFALVYAGDEISFSNIPALLGCWLILLIFSLGFSLIMAVLGDLSEELAKFVKSFFFILYFLSAVMYSVNTIPVQYHVYILWNPIVHGLEYMRHTINPDYSINFISLRYLIYSTIIVLFVGLLSYKSRERIMLKTK